MKKELKTGWKSAPIRLCRSPEYLKQLPLKESILSLNGEAAVYSVTNWFSEGTVDLSVVGFIDPRTKRAFIGRPAAFFVESKSKIYGGSFLAAGIVWEESFVSDLKVGSVGEAKTTFERQADMQKILEQELSMERETPIRDILGLEFFSASPGASNFGKVKVMKVSIKEGLLRVDLESPSSVYRGTLWLDMDKREVVKAVRDGQQVFPTVR